MVFWDKFKKNKTTDIAEKSKIQNFFNFPRNAEGIQKIVAWLKNADEIILENDSSGNVAIRHYQDKDYLIAYTNTSQRRGGWEKKEKFSSVKFEDFSNIFEHYPQAQALWLNPDSDSVLINRLTFSSERVMTEDTTVKIAKPKVIPADLIEILVDFASKTDTIEKIYLALMNKDDEFSYVVSFEQKSTSNIQEINAQISEQLAQLYQKKSDETLFPVYFVNETTLSLEEDEYLIYEK
ncbi:hypothetical protein Hs30E_09770 [Lactococcus hodotermopsidis]|uniref:SseB protein C-terminal domain-containing protein n=1 Tax=Pseudolactococcus hodotermopsidis TaxID=2709157 RepID=A0A6A0BC49_9LACT|nr:enhanced serine sensitivity protein SseB C-terminal domain-containing protein [Lactococcus hodotermopsidis]GFH42426.1 hypothetical protein Hs30E_09770 [Lactococcus hodotermopsidis]